MLATTLENEFCPSCNADSNTVGVSLGAPVWQCRNCSLWFLPALIRPRADIDNHWYATFNEFGSDYAKAFDGHMGHSYTQQLNTLAKYTTGRKLLDIGCGIGVFLHSAKRAGWSPIGCETSEHAAGFAKKHYGVEIVSNLTAFAQASFDVVRLSHVLEHIPEPLGIVKEIERLLRPNGLVAIIVPTAEPLSSWMLNRFRRWIRRSDRLATAVYPDMHVLGFNVRALRNLFETHGFKTECAFSVSMGSREYFPMFYDGLLSIKPWRKEPLRSLLRFWLPQWVDNFGHVANRGTWTVAYFRKL